MSGYSPTVVFRKDRLADIIGNYFRRVARFKWLNGFRPDERINQPKMAALIVEAIKAEDDREPLFTIPSTLAAEPFSHEVFYEFIYGVIASTLFIRLSDVDQNHKRDLLLCLDQHDIATEWLAWALHNFCVAYGDLDKTVGD